MRLIAFVDTTPSVVQREKTSYRASQRATSSYRYPIIYTRHRYNDCIRIPVCRSVKQYAFFMEERSIRRVVATTNSFVDLPALYSRTAERGCQPPGWPFVTLCQTFRAFLPCPGAARGNRALNRLMYKTCRLRVRA